MKVLEVILGVLFSVITAVLPVSWIWSLFHIVKCRKKQSCEKRKCTYWEMCTHNEQTRRADVIFRRIRLLETETGMTLLEEENQE